MEQEPWLVIGLGNPGPQYAGNRHNIGTMIAAELATRMGASFSSHKQTRSQVAVGRLGVGAGGAPGPRVIVATLGSFMNTSGGPSSALVHYYGVSAEHLIVLHDELDIPFGTVRVKRGGGEGGHNGLRDISKALGTKDYVRVRAGIGRPPGRMDVADFVLRDFATAERGELAFLIDKAADAAEAVVLDGLVAAQNAFNAE